MLVAIYDISLYQPVSTHMIEARYVILTTTVNDEHRVGVGHDGTEDDDGVIVLAN